MSRIILRVFAACVLATAMQHVDAQNYPNKPIKLIVTFAAGGGADFMGRLIGQKLAEMMGQAVIVDNRAGAGGAIGNEAVAKAAPDGYTLLLGAAGPLVISPALYTKMNYDVLKDLAPITLLAHVPFALCAHPSVPANNVKELISLAKRRPGKLNFGSSGTAGAPHLAGELFKASAGVDLVHVPYKGLAPAITDLIGGQLDLIFADVNLVKQHVDGNRLRGLAVTGATRSAIMPQLPTVSEAALPGYQAGTWYGVLAPSGVPREVIAKLNVEISRILASSEIRERLATQGAEPAGNTPEQFAAMIKAELNKWAKVVEAANIKLD